MDNCVISSFSNSFSFTGFFAVFEGIVFAAVVFLGVLSMIYGLSQPVRIQKAEIRQIDLKYFMSFPLIYK